MIERPLQRERNTIQLGHSLVCGIPFEWCQQNSIDKGTKLYFIVEGDCLRIYCDSDKRKHDFYRLTEEYRSAKHEQEEKQTFRGTLENEEDQPVVEDGTIDIKALIMAKWNSDKQPSTMLEKAIRGR